ncbi:MAG: protein translocase subunit SecF [Roseiflexaceae bacterium]|jgi:preprotein translocase subunit SecF|nr:protein translocase subunit SecF [Chloroflexaceae bacterium]MCE2853259.1 protein translocase subunit SecF [Chloroflexaceae bacterium]
MKSIVGLRYVWFIISLVVIIPGAVFFALYGLRTGIDFAGGALWDLHFVTKQTSDLDTDKIASVFKANGFESAQVQISTVKIDGKDVASAVVRTKELSATNPEQQQRDILDALNKEYGEVRRESLQSVGPTVSSEATRSAAIAVLGACLAILVYMTLAFNKAPNPFRYGMCALLAMLHDVLVVLGVAAILGYTIGLEVDAYFLTALLTVISFSVHDTIVVFDRIRENLAHRRAGESFEDIVNHSIVQTLPRSLNTQLTSIFTLLALLLFGGATIQNLVIILLVGLISGTYSSIFNAAQLLVVWENREWQHWFRRQAA